MADWQSQFTKQAVKLPLLPLAGAGAGAVGLGVGSGALNEENAPLAAAGAAGGLGLTGAALLGNKLLGHPLGRKLLMGAGGLAGVGGLAAGVSQLPEESRPLAGVSLGAAIPAALMMRYSPAARAAVASMPRRAMDFVSRGPGRYAVPPAALLGTGAAGIGIGEAIRQAKPTTSPGHYNPLSAPQAGNEPAPQGAGEGGQTLSQMLMPYAPYAAGAGIGALGLYALYRMMQNRDRDPYGG